MNDTTPLELSSSRESEEALLGAIFINPKILDSLSLRPEEFFLTRHQIVYRAMEQIGSDDVDVVSVAELIKRWGEEDVIGGISYLTGLMSRCPNAYNYEVHEKIIRDTFSRREIINAAMHLVTTVSDETSNTTKAVSDAVSKLVQVARPVAGTHHVSRFLKELCEQVEERAEDPKDIYGLATGLYDFDRITHGLQKKEEVILSGAPGTGKTLLAVQLAFGLAQNGHPGVFYELEMSGLALVRRQVSAMSKIRTYNMRSGVDMNSHWGGFNNAIEKLENLPLYISDESRWSSLEIRADLAKMKHDYGIEWFMVDYMENLSDEGDRDERMKNITKNLHDIAKDLDVAALILQSVTKQGFNQSRGSMEHVSGPHNVHHEADDVIIMTKGSPDNPNLEDVRTLTWDKKREADDAGILSLYKVPGLPLFQQYKREVEEVSVPDWYNN